MREWWTKIQAIEPARVRSVWIALVGLGASLGFTLDTEVDGAIQGVIVAVFTLLPLLQGELIRAKVTPVAKDEEEIWWALDEDATEDLVLDDEAGDLTEDLLEE
jgi:hypothetical protein